MNKRNRARAPGRAIRQRRGQKTYDALVSTGFELLQHKEFESITIAELAKAAGYSVGAFYARFHSKDEYLDALIARHIDYRQRARGRVFASSTPETLVENVIRELVGYYWKRRGFWRAALLRGMRAPEFWQPIRDYGEESANALVAKIAVYAGRDLDPTEDMNVRFAFQMALGLINNSIVNRPGPSLYLGRTRFVANLARAFRLVANYDALIGADRPTPARRRAGR